LGEVRFVKVRYTRRALSQLEKILRHIRGESPAGAQSVELRLRAVVNLLESHPFLGRQMQEAGVRRIVVDPYPYLIFYRATQTEVVILRIRHAARRPLPNLS
jgi:toxin ParE1/3/4